jgi:hypothetical protein
VPEARQKSSGADDERHDAYQRRDQALRSSMGAALAYYTQCNTDDSSTGMRRMAGWLLTLSHALRPGLPILWSDILTLTLV